MRLTILRNDPECTAGHLERVARERGVDIEVVALDAGESLPPAASVEAVAVLGGGMGAYDTDRVPYLIAEKQWLAEVAEADVPVLGICLGCQLLADVLGGSAYLAERPEIEFTTLDIVTPDPVVDVLGRSRSLVIHRDTWDVPPGAQLIARTDRFNQAFRRGSVLGIQPHPEVDPDIVGVWTANPEIIPFLRAGGRGPGDVRSWIRDNAASVAGTADELFGAWLEEASARIG